LLQVVHRGSRVWPVKKEKGRAEARPGRRGPEGPAAGSIS
jgi:hypothetical protein